MQLPKYKKKKRIKLKVCQYPGCGKEFWGHPIAKYCEEHRDIKNRAKFQKKDTVSIKENNMIIKHNYTEVVETKILCSLDGCDHTYGIKIFPKQYVYPRFCEFHRNAHKRAHFIRIQKSTKRLAMQG